MAKKDYQDKAAGKLSEQKQALAETGDLAKTDAAAAKAAKAAELAKAKEEKAAAAAAAKAAKAAEPKPERATTGVGNIIDRSKHQYAVDKEHKTAGGRASVDNADPLAAALRGKSAGDVIDLVQANGGEVNPAWENRNQGLARMAAGNVLRKLARRSEGVTIDGVVVKLDPLPKVEKPETAAKAA